MRGGTSSFKSKMFTSGRASASIAATQSGKILDYTFLKALACLAGVQPLTSVHKLSQKVPLPTKTRTLFMVLRSMSDRN